MSPTLPTVKPMYSGFVTRDYIIRKGHWAEPFCRVWSCRFEWRSFEPQRGVYVYDVLDRFIQGSYDRGMDAMRARFYCGIYAPDWFKALAGGPIALSNPFDKLPPVPVGLWYEPEPQRAYRDACAALRDRYDGEPMLAEVIAGLTGLHYPEPFIRGMSSRANREVLRAAGYTWEKDKAAQKAMVNAHRQLRQTRCGLQFNVPQNPEARDWRGDLDPAFATEFALYARSRLGRRAVYENTSLDEPSHVASDQAAFYNTFAELHKTKGANIALQTERVTGTPEIPRRFGDPDKAFTYAVGLGVAAIETQYDGAVITPQVLEKFTPMLKANAA